MGSTLDTPPRPAVSHDHPVPTPSRCDRRISKACEECRRRKIKCDGLPLCTPCTERGLSNCFYRYKTRDRKRKEINRERPSVRSFDREKMQVQETDSDSHTSISAPSTFPLITRRVSSLSSQRSYQVHYGASSNISLLNHLYQSFNPFFGGNFLLRRLNYFCKSLGQEGAEMSGTDITSETSYKTVLPADELPFSIAAEILEHFLAVHWFLIPVQSPEVLRSDLRAFYDMESSSELSNFCRRALLLVLAIASLTTRHHSLADILISQFNESTISADDNLTTISIQIDCLLISFPPFPVITISLTGISGIYACYYTEKGLFNDAYLAIGSGIRKSFCAGLHKDPPQGSRSDLEMEEQRNIAWVLYNFESWICVHLGRPSSFSAVKLAVPLPKNTFLLALVKLSDIMNRCSKEIYIPTKGSLLSIWTSAVSIMSELHDYEDEILATLGFGLHYRSHVGDSDARQTILTTLYLHIFILVFRPFVIFSGKLKIQQASLESNDDRSRVHPPWLPKACSYALGATKRLIDYIYLAMLSNQIVKSLRYTHVFLENCCAVLGYEILHDRNKVTANVPWITKSLDCLSQMRPGDSIQRIITSFENLLAGIELGPACNDSRTTEGVFANEHMEAMANPASPNMDDPSTWTQTKDDIQALDEAIRYILT